MLSLSTELSAELEQVAQALRRLRPSWHSLEPFYEQRSEIAGALMRLSRKLAGGAMPVSPQMPQRRDTFHPRVTAAPVRPPAPTVIVSPPPPAPARPRPRWMHRHRYPRPPRLPPDVQPMMFDG